MGASFKTFFRFNRISVFFVFSGENWRNWFICKGGCFSVAETEKFIFWRWSRREGGMTNAQQSLRRSVP
jgi:hypothetical protein